VALRCSQGDRGALRKIGCHYTDLIGLPLGVAQVDKENPLKEGVFTTHIKRRS